MMIMFDDDVEDDERKIRWRRKFYYTVQLYKQVQAVPVTSCGGP
jgi:hypothetical protein